MADDSTGLIATLDLGANRAGGYFLKGQGDAKSVCLVKPVDLTGLVMIVVCADLVFLTLEQGDLRWLITRHRCSNLACVMIVG